MKLTGIAISFLLVALPLACTRKVEDSTYQMAASHGEFDHSHGIITEILAKHVEDGRVDYQGLKRNPEPLTGYLDTLAAVPEASFESWSQDDKKAFLINLYNASTLKLVADHYPVRSIKEIGGRARDPWQLPVVKLFGRWTTLDHVEHDLLRPMAGDARIHFAVNCASNGCPPLRPKAFQGTGIDAQLDEQGRLFLRDATKNEVDPVARVHRVSPIFKWYESDFTAQSGDIGSFVSPFLNEVDRKHLEGGGFEVKAAGYDWSLNDR